MSAVNGLFPTRHRLALLSAIADGKGRIYCEPGTNRVYDKLAGCEVTERVREQIRHEWIRALKPDEPRGPGESKALVYYRLTDKAPRS